MGEKVGNIYPAGYHAHSEPMQIELDPSAPSDEWRVHLGSTGLDEAVTVDAQDIADLAFTANGQAQFDNYAGATADWYDALTGALKARCRWAWANRP